MTNEIKRLLIGLIIAILLVALIPTFSSASELSSNTSGESGFIPKEDNLPDPLTDKQLKLKKKALEANLNGKAYGKTYQVTRGQYVELEREGEGAIWTVLGEFADLKHNQIPQPDRTVNNTTLWVSDFNRDHFLNILFSNAPGSISMRNFYEEQSSNRYTVFGDVTGWISVPKNAVYYDDDPDSNVWYFLQDSVNGWYNAEIASSKTPDQINEYLSQFDKRDRFDYDRDGNFDEPDGYIDTFQSVHAGEGEEAAGAPAWTIWSHSWYAYPNLIGIAGPGVNKLGGIQIGNSDYRVGKYTIQPENGGVGVFAHEFGHDLGLPDLDDTSGGENGTGFWTLMSLGCKLGDGTVDIGSKPSHMGAWEKFQLGWLNYQVAYADKKARFMLGPMETNTRRVQGLFVILPPKLIISNLGAPYAGSYYYYSGPGYNLDNFMYKSFNLPAASTLNAKVKYDIELDWDYAYLVYSTDNGATWTSLQTNLSTTSNPNSQNKGFGITGVSGGWVDLAANLPAGKVLLGFRYETDANTGGFGLMVDDIDVIGLPSDGAETDAGWTYMPTGGFHVTNGTETRYYDHYYIAEYRQYRDYDTTLKVGPYFFGYMNNPDLVNYVDHFPYQDGLLINYWDTSQNNNQTKVHPGAGLLLPIDAHPKALENVNGMVWQNHIQTYDSTFTLDRTDAVNNLHVNSLLSPIHSLPAAKVFDDRILYWDAANPQGSVKNPNTGTIIEIRSINALGGFMEVQVHPAK